MALGKKRSDSTLRDPRNLRPSSPRSLEELANLADAWADLAERHRWSPDAVGFAEESSEKLRQKAAQIRAILLVQAGRQARGL